MIGDKRRWRQYKARTRQLPENYRTAVDAIERYLMYFGAQTATVRLPCSRTLLTCSNGRGRRHADPRIVGEDPIEFVESFLQNYARRRDGSAASKTG